MVGALLGLLLGATRATTASASEVLSIQPVQPLSSVSIGAAGSGDVTTFIQGELVVLNGGDLRGKVQQELGLASAPQNAASQIGATYAVTVTVTASNSNEALREVRALADTYTGDRRARLELQVTDALASVSIQLDSLRAALATPELQPNRTGPVNLQTNGLQTELARLLAINSSLTLSRGQLDSATTVLQTAAADGQGRLSPSVRYALGLGLLGALAGAALLAMRQRGQGLAPGAELVGLGAPVLQPELDPSAAPATYAATARLLGARLLRTDSGGAVLVMFGATSRVDAGEAAAAVAQQLAERAPVLLLQLTDVLAPAGAIGRGALDLLDRPLDSAAVLAVADSHVLPGVQVVARGGGAGGPGALQRLLEAGLVEAAAATGCTVLVDAPALDVSTAAVDLARRAHGAALVADPARTSRTQVQAVIDVLAAQDVPLTGIVLVRRLRRTGRGAGGATGHQEPAPKERLSALHGSAVPTPERDVAR